MKILYTHRTQGRGAEGAHVAGMVEAFRELGHDVVVDCMPGCDPTIARAPTSESADRAPVEPSLLSRFSAHAPQWLFGVMQLLYNLPLGLRLLPRLLLNRPSLVYERYALCTFAPTLLCRALGIPHVLEINDSVAIERSRPLTQVRTSRIIERMVIERTHLAITVSSRFLDQIRESLGPLRTDFLICPNAVSHTRFLNREPLSNAKRAELRARFGIGDGPVLGSAGQFVAWHGLPQFVAAAAELIRHRGLHLLFIGDGPTRDDTVAAAARQGVAGQVHFTGMVPHHEVPDHLDLVDIAIIPFSNTHGSPMKLMEFMAMGLPVVAPALPPILEVVEDARTGFLFPPGDMATMSQVLERCLTQADHAKQVGRAARDYVAKQLTWSVHARRVLQALFPESAR